MRLLESGFPRILVMGLLGERDMLQTRVDDKIIDAEKRRYYSWIPPSGLRESLIHPQIEVTPP